METVINTSKYREQKKLAISRKCEKDNGRDILFISFLYFIFLIYNK